MTPPDPFALAAQIGPMLDALGIRYVVGGSVASTYYGEARSTDDLDLVVEIDVPKVRLLVPQLKPDFYIDEEDAVEAVRHRTVFSAIHFETTTRVDFFIAESRAEVRKQLDRRRIKTIGETRVSFYAPEDILLRKLIWFRMGGEVSDRQWRDIVGILRIAREPLDNAYLERAAASFEVSDLLTRAREAAK